MNLATVTVEGIPDGMRLEQWWESRDVSRSTAFRLLRLAGIEPTKVRVPDVRTPVSWLAQEGVEQMDTLAQKIRNGASLTDLERQSSGAMVPAAAQQLEEEPVVVDPETSRDVLDSLKTRAEAAAAVIASGLPLSTREVTLLLGAKPGGPVVTRGRVTARRHGRNCWTLEVAE
jgi:hypothetical protein